MRVKLMTCISNSGDKAIVVESFGEVVERGADCSVSDFQLALKPGSVMQIPVPDPAPDTTAIAASRVKHLQTIGKLNQIRVDLQESKYAEADSSLKQYIQAYVDEFTTSIAAGRG
jgi:hypothetical protein